MTFKILLRLLCLRYILWSCLLCEWCVSWIVQYLRWKCPKYKNVSRKEDSLTMTVLDVVWKYSINYYKYEVVNLSLLYYVVGSVWPFVGRHFSKLLFWFCSEQQCGCVTTVHVSVLVLHCWYNLPVFSLLLLTI